MPVPRDAYVLRIEGLPPCITSRWLDAQGQVYGAPAYCRVVHTPVQVEALLCYRTEAETALARDGLEQQPVAGHTLSCQPCWDCDVADFYDAAEAAAAAPRAAAPGGGGGARQVAGGVPPQSAAAAGPPTAPPLHPQPGPRPPLIAAAPATRAHAAEPSDSRVAAIQRELAELKADMARQLGAAGAPRAGGQRATGGSPAKRRRSNDGGDGGGGPAARPPGAAAPDPAAAATGIRGMGADATMSDDAAALIGLSLRAPSHACCAEDDAWLLGWWRAPVLGDAARRTYEHACGPLTDFARRFPEWIEVSDPDPDDEEDGGITLASLKLVRDGDAYQASLASLSDPSGDPAAAEAALPGCCAAARAAAGDAALPAPAVGMAKFTL